MSYNSSKCTRIELCVMEFAPWPFFFGGGGVVGASGIWEVFWHMGFFFNLKITKHHSTDT